MKKYNAVIPYTSALPNKHCLQALNTHFPYWRWLVSPASVRSFGKNREPLLYKHGYALDNGAYSYWNRNLDFPSDKFRTCVDRYGERADWIVLPDVIGDWQATNEFSNEWYEELRDVNQLLIVAQNGSEEDNYRDLCTWIDKGCGVFVGGDDEFKKAHTSSIIRLCKENGVICHVGRVNSMKRATWCNNIGAFSFDGSGMARFTKQANYMSRHMSSMHNQISLLAVDDYIENMQKKYDIS